MTRPQLGNIDDFINSLLKPAKTAPAATSTPPQITINRAVRCKIYINVPAPSENGKDSLPDLKD